MTCVNNGKNEKSTKRERAGRVGVACGRHNDLQVSRNLKCWSQGGMWVPDGGGGALMSWMGIYIRTAKRPQT